MQALNTLTNDVKSLVMRSLDWLTWSLAVNLETELVAKCSSQEEYQYALSALNSRIIAVARARKYDNLKQRQPHTRAQSDVLEQQDRRYCRMTNDKPAPVVPLSPHERYLQCIPALSDAGANLVPTPLRASMVPARKEPAYNPLLMTNCVMQSQAASKLHSSLLNNDKN